MSSQVELLLTHYPFTSQFHLLHSLKISSNWYIYKESQHRQQKKENTSGLLAFSELPGLTFYVADRTDSALPWLVSRGRSYGLLWSELINRLFEEWQSTLFSKRPARSEVLVEHWTHRVRRTRSQKERTTLSKEPNNHYKRQKGSCRFYAGILGI
jgi:hypothetical protein